VLGLSGSPSDGGTAHVQSARAGNAASTAASTMTDNDQSTKAPITDYRGRCDLGAEMDVVYEIRLGSNGRPERVVFAERTRVEHVAQIWKALVQSTTWGGFRHNLPEGEWDDNLADRFDEIPPDDEPFMADAVPGHADGDYPEWLRQVQLDWFPQELIDKYGDVRPSVLNGEFLDLPPDKAEQIAADLRAMGHTVAPTDLAFGW
jgi:hypothetical protein